MARIGDGAVIGSSERLRDKPEGTENRSWTGAGDCGRVGDVAGLGSGVLAAAETGAGAGARTGAAVCIGASVCSGAGVRAGAEA